MLNKLMHRDGMIIAIYGVYIVGIYAYVMTTHVNLQVPMNSPELLELTLWTGALYALLYNYNPYWMNGVIAICEFDLTYFISQYGIDMISKFAGHQVVGCVVTYTIIQLLLTAYYHNSNVN